MGKGQSLFAELRRREVFQSTAVYVVGAWVVLQVSDVLFPGAGIPDSAIRYVFAGIIVGFPVALVFAWRYDLTRRGVRRTPETGKPGDDSLPLSRHDVAVLAGLGTLSVTIIAVVAVQVMATAQPSDPAAVMREAAENSIAVLPFVSMSNDVDDEYFGDGIAEELLNELANLNSLRVAARTSSFFFKGKNQPVQEIGQALGVRNVVEGSVRRSGSRLRITAQLINVDDGYHLWSETYDREQGDVFEIQEEIARAITSALEVTILGKESRNLARAPTESFEAYDYYLLAKHQRELRNPEALEKAIELFRQALAQDEAFAPAYAALAATYVYQFYYSGLTAEEARVLAEPLIERALELEPELPQAHAASGTVSLMLRDFEAADASNLRAVELRPNYAAAYSNLGFSMVLQSRLIDADEYYSKSRVLDPLSTSLTFNVAALRMLSGRYEEGMELFRQVRELSPQESNTGAAMVHWSVAYGRYEDALGWLGDAEEFEPGSARQLTYLARIATGLGIWDEARDYLARASVVSPTPGSLKNLTARFLFVSGDHVGLGELVEQEFERAGASDSAVHTPTTFFRYMWRGISAVAKGNYLQAESDLIAAVGGEEAIADVVFDDIEPLKYLAYAYQKTGRHDDAAALLQQCLQLGRQALEQGWNTPVSHVRIAGVYSLQGDVDNALRELELALAAGWRSAGELETDPLWDNLQNDVRYQAIIRRVNDELATRRENVSIMPSA